MAANEKQLKEKKREKMTLTDKMVGSQDRPDCLQLHQSSAYSKHRRQSNTHTHTYTCTCSVADLTYISLHPQCLVSMATDFSLSNWAENCVTNVRREKKLDSLPLFIYFFLFVGDGSRDL